MKKIFSLLCAAAVLSLTIISCSKNESVDQNAKGVTKSVSFSATSPATKSYFGEKSGTSYPTVWTANTDVAINLNMATTYKKATVVPKNEGRNAAFSVEITQDDNDSYTFYALSPYTSVVSVNSERVNLTIPQDQTPTNTSVDEAAHVMVGKSETLTAWPEEGVVVPLAFQHVAAYGKFKLLNFPETVTISSITLEAEDYIAGRFLFYPETFTMDVNSGSKSLVIHNTIGGELTNADLNFWFAIRPVDMSSKSLKVSVTTDAGVYEKTINFPSDKGNFVSGKVASFNIDMDGITPSTSKVYALVTALDDLLEDSEVIIVSVEDSKAMSTTQNGNNRPATGVEIDTDSSVPTITNPSSTVQVFVLEQGTVSNTVAFKCSNGDHAGQYIYAASSSYNYLRTESDTDDNASFSISIAKGGVATIKAQGTNTRNWLRYNPNSGSPIFSCYAASSSLKDVALYKLVGSGEGEKLVEEVTENPVISFNSETNTVTITCPTEGAHIGYTIDGTEPGIDDETGDPIGTTMEYTEPFTITESCTVKAFAGADHMLLSGVVSLECKVAGDYDFETIAELNALATTTATSFSGHLTNAVVSYVPATNTAIIKDATGSVTYFKTGHGLKQGQTFTGDITVTLQLYSNFSEITVISATFTGDETVVEPETLALSSLVGNYSTYQNAYVKVENLEVTSVSTSDSGSNVNVTDGTNTYVVFTNKFSSSVSVGDVITAIGTVTKYQTTEEIKVWVASNLIVAD